MTLPEATVTAMNPRARVGCSMCNGTGRRQPWPHSNGLVDCLCLDKNFPPVVPDTMTREEAFVTAHNLLQDGFDGCEIDERIERDGTSELTYYIFSSERMPNDQKCASGSTWSEAIADLMRSLEEKSRLRNRGST